MCSEAKPSQLFLVLIDLLVIYSYHSCLLHGLLSIPLYFPVALQIQKYIINKAPEIMKNHQKNEVTASNSADKCFSSDLIKLTTKPHNKLSIDKTYDFGSLDGINDFLTTATPMNI